MVFITLRLNMSQDRSSDNSNNREYKLQVKEKEKIIRIISILHTTLREKLWELVWIAAHNMNIIIFNLLSLL